jgi:hypothetical protein
MLTDAVHSRLCGRVAHRAFTIVEVLASIGILMLLIALTMPLIGSAMQSGKRARCEVQLRSHLVVLSAYAGDFRDFWPFPLDSAGKLAAETGLAHADLTLGGTPHDFGPASVASGLWHMPPLDAYNQNPFHESLICPSDHETLAARERLAAERGVPLSAVRGTLAYQMSMALLLDPAALNPESPSQAPRYLRGVTHAEVTYPSHKGGVYEIVPFHEQRYRSDPHITLPYRLVMGACDGSVRYRALDQCAPGVVFQADGLESEYRARLSALHAVMYTPKGVRGRDW